MVPSTDLKYVTTVLLIVIHSQMPVELIVPHLAVVITSSIPEKRVMMAILMMEMVVMLFV
jgi:hypothetical protein